MKRILFIIILLYPILSIGQQSVRYRQVTADTIKLKDIGANTWTPASGFGNLFIKSDTLFYIDDSGVVTNLMNRVTSLSFNTSTGLLTVNRFSGGPVTVSLDGRYALTTGANDIANNTWFTSYDALGNPINLWKVNTNKLFEFGVDAGIGSLYTASDAGSVWIANMPVINSVYGTKMEYKIGIDDNSVAKLGAYSDGTGGTYGQFVNLSGASTITGNTDITGNLALTGALSSTGNYTMNKTNPSILFNTGGLTQNQILVSSDGTGSRFALYGRTPTGGTEEMFTVRTNGNWQIFQNDTATASPGAGFGFIRMRGGKLYFENSAATEYDLTAGISASVANTWTANQTMNDNYKWLFGDSGAEFEVYSDGTTGVIKAKQHLLMVDASGNTQLKISNSASSGTTLYGGGLAKLQTLSTGTTVTGDMSVSGNIDAVNYHTVKVSLNNGEVYGAWETPHVLIAAPGTADKIIEVTSITIRINYLTAAFTDTYFAFGSSSTVLSGVQFMLDNSDVTTTSTKIFRVPMGNQYETDTADVGYEDNLVVGNNEAFVFSPTADVVSGGGSIDLYITYRIITL